MPNTFSKWIDKKLSLPLPKWDQEPPLPTLPPTRPRVLTPSPSRETLTASAASATSTSAFFQTLPFEIRHKILKEAFGNYTMHMHLSYDLPKPPLSIRQQDPKHRHANVRKVPTLPSPQSKFSIPKRKTWQWWSCICHRASPWTLSQSRPPAHMLDKPCYDGCYTTIGSSWCEFWPGEAPGKCFIGVMGWLLSCRQAYAECITILYSANTIHMASSIMFRHLPQLLLPQRLSTITSIEMIWTTHPTRYGTDQPNSLDSFGLPATHSLMSVLETALPNLKCLSLTLSSDLTLGHKDDNPTASTPIDDRVRRRRPRLEECYVYIPWHIYEERRERGEATGEGSDDGGLGDERFWRQLPGADVGDEAIPVDLRGYW
ncbi:hypothetical protein VE04_10049, partial [Pseudogymnoascus sp. 24MN13]